MRDKRNFYDNMHRQSKVINDSGKYSVEKEKSFNNYLRYLNNRKQFDKELYDNGIEYYNLGGILEDAKDELKNNLSFISGYNHAKRLAYVQEVEEKYNNKSR